MPPRILLTGLPGCGKTTVVTKVADLLRGRASGFYTEEVRDATGQRIGFRVISLEGERGELARKGTGSGPRVGSYCVNVKDFERIALPTLEAKEGRVLLIDEIGKMESFSVQFVRRVEKAFESEASILATIPLKGGGTGTSFRKMSRESYPRVLELEVTNCELKESASSRGNCDVQ